ncbi:MAG: hypothetical protein LBR80_15485 [Deltaproteobacteria bacterium]|jgi:hypothetical protein|nr:hypothetical protein [Deltaproteobacteria bacterium]
MGYDNRLKLFRKCEDLTGKPLITYVTSLRPNASSEMASDAILPLIELVQEVPIKYSKVDFLIVSNGGDPITALRIIDILRERFNHISVLVPFVAFSAATLLSLGANEIVMHPYSNLGPVDPQIIVFKQDKFGNLGSFHINADDIWNYLDFIRSDFGISSESNLSSALSHLVGEVDPLIIGASKRSQQLTHSLSVKLLETHLAENKERAETIAQALNTPFYHHGFSVTRKEARKIGLEIAEDNPTLESIIWDIWKDYCDEMQCYKAFDIYSELMAYEHVKQFILNPYAVSLTQNTTGKTATQLSSQFGKFSIWLQQFYSCSTDAY